MNKCKLILMYVDRWKEGGIKKGRRGTIEDKRRVEGRRTQTRIEKEVRTKDSQGYRGVQDKERKN